MIRFKSVMFVGAVVLVGITSQLVFGQQFLTTGPPNPFLQGQPFRSLIDDVIVRPAPPILNCELNAPCAGACESGCDGSCRQVTFEADDYAPGMAIGSEEFAQALFEADGLVAGIPKLSKSRPCKRCETKCEFSICGSAGSGCSKSCNSAGNEAVDLDNYCDELAGHLADTIATPELDTMARRRAIKAALKMVAEQSQAKFAGKLSTLETEHREELSEKEFDSETLCLLRADIQRIENNQARSLNYLNSLSQFCNSINKRNTDAVAQDNSDRGTHSTRQLMIDEISLRLAKEREMAKLRREMEVLDTRIQELQQNAVQPARHLEPLYPADDLLRPISGSIRRR